VNHQKEDEVQINHANRRRASVWRLVFLWFLYVFFFSMSQSSSAGRRGVVARLVLWCCGPVGACCCGPVGVVVLCVFWCEQQLTARSSLRPPRSRAAGTQTAFTGLRSAGTVTLCQGRCVHVNFMLTQRSICFSISLTHYTMVLKWKLLIYYIVLLMSVFSLFVFFIYFVFFIILFLFYFICFCNLQYFKKNIIRI